VSLDFFFDVKPHHATINKARQCRCVKPKPGRLRWSAQQYSREEYKAAQVQIREQADRQLERRRFDDLPCYVDGPVHVVVTTHAERVHRSGAAAGLAFIDADATTKCVLDALTGVAYTDDAQVQSVTATKTTDGPVGIRVRVYRPEGEQA
jgi:Holliday junction resolvase RusA-like endonuclease